MNIRVNNFTSYDIKTCQKFRRGPATLQKIERLRQENGCVQETEEEIFSSSWEVDDTQIDGNGFLRE